MKEWLKIFDGYEVIAEEKFGYLDNLLLDLCESVIKNNLPVDKWQSLLDALTDRAQKWDRKGMHGIAKLYWDNFDYMDNYFYSNIYED